MGERHDGSLGVGFGGPGKRFQENGVQVVDTDDWKSLGLLRVV